MAVLSSNWKKLQAKLQAEETLQSSSKRKADDSPRHRPAKRQKAAVEPVTSSRKQDATERHTDRARRPEMGGVHSSITESEPGTGSSPFLALWAADNDISAETLAEAYGLGLKSDFIAVKDDDRINYGLSSDIKLGKYVALDCEMVGVGSGGYRSALARVSLVDFHGRQIYDSFVKPKEKVTDWRTAYSGISPKDMKLARDFKDVQGQVSNLLKDRILVGHDLRHDLGVLELWHPRRDVRDTAHYSEFKTVADGNTPSLRLLAKELLGVQIHDEAHSSIEDARVTMLLFRKHMHKPGFDGGHANQSTSKRATARHKGKRKTKAKTEKFDW